MSPRRPAARDPNREALERHREDILLRLEGQRDEMLMAFERLEASVGRLGEEIRRGNLNHDELKSYVMGLERQVQDTRDSVNLSSRQSISEAARGAAQGASVAAVAPAVEQAVKVAARSANSKNRLYIIIGASLMGLSTFIDKAPAIMKWIESIWNATKAAGK